MVTADCILCGRGKGDSTEALARVTGMVTICGGGKGDSAEAVVRVTGDRIIGC